MEAAGRTKGTHASARMPSTKSERPRHSRLEGGDFQPPLDVQQRRARRDCCGKKVSRHMANGFCAVLSVNVMSCMSMDGGGEYRFPIAITKGWQHALDSRYRLHGKWHRCRGFVPQVASEKVCARDASPAHAAYEYGGRAGLDSAALLAASARQLHRNRIASEHLL